MTIFKTLAEKFGFRKNEQLTINQALHIAHKEASRSEADIRKEAETIAYAPSVMSPEDRQKYLNYCLSLCKGHEDWVTILKLKIGMSTVPEFQRFNSTQKNIAIAQKLKEYGIHATFREVEKLEKEAIKFVQDQITRTKETCIPIL